MAEAPKTMNQATWSALGLAWDLGYTIAVPLVVLALLGRLVDRSLGTSPWFLLAGVLLSIVASTFLVLRKTQAIMADSKTPPPPADPRSNFTV